MSSSPSVKGESHDIDGRPRSQIEKHREMMKEKKRMRDRERRRQETLEMRRKVLSGELSIHPEALRARKRRQARNNKPNFKTPPPPPPPVHGIVSPSLSSISSEPSSPHTPSTPQTRVKFSSPVTPVTPVPVPEEASVASILVGLFSKSPKDKSNQPILPAAGTFPPSTSVRVSFTRDEVKTHALQMPPPRFDLESRSNLKSASSPSKKLRSSS